MLRRRIERMNRLATLGTLLVCLFVTGCKDDDGDGAKPQSGGSAATDASAPAKVRLTLDWKPEPEFGGFFAAKLNGAFEKKKLDVDIKAGGAGAPTWQLVAQGRSEFGTTAADQVLVARSRDADVVAVFAVHQTSPQGVMTHRARGFTRLADVFANPGTLAAEDNAWLKFCRKKLDPVQVSIQG